MKSSRGSVAEVSLEVEPLGQRAAPRRSDDRPFRIVILGDFSGRENRGSLQPGARPAARRPLEVDRDNLDAVVARLNPTLRLPLTSSQGPGLSLSLHELDDFHPDRLWARVELFGKLRTTRQRLLDPSTFAETARALGVEPRVANPSSDRPATTQPPRAPEVTRLASGSLLEEMLEQAATQPQSEPPARGGDDFARFLRDLVGPHLVAATDPRQAELIARVDRLASDLMWALMHHPAFQALEAAWRAVAFLVRRLETGRTLKLYLLDVSKAEVARDLLSPGLDRSTGLYKLLVEPAVGTAGADPWALVVGNYTFGAARADAELLGKLGKLAQAAGAPFLAAASPSLLGCASAVQVSQPEDWGEAGKPQDARAWAALRSSAEASYLGLALPRFLLRLPYGKDTEATENFDFEEMPGQRRHDDYLWGNPAFALALVMGEAFLDQGWALRLGAGYNIGNLPLHTYREEGESHLEPCAETLLTEAAATRILERGLMPLASLKHQDAVRLVRFQSLGAPPQPLAGRWSQTYPKGDG